MNEFEGASDGKRRLGRFTEKGRCFEHEKGPEPLAAAEDGMAHGSVQARRHRGLPVEQTGEIRLDSRLRRGETVFEAYG